MSDLFAHKKRRARKTHRCDLCGTTIRPGDTYSHETGTADGRFLTWRNCAPCDEVISAASIDYYETDGVGVTADDAQVWAEDHPDDPVATAYIERTTSDHT
ncbi:MAG TPA: hypothetical protein DCL06_06265 [Corynebacterium variabile]|uniref:Uncharacterized protein n=1 Tax=Corynebacterium variabile TaxID=1727 RepID=A0A3B9QV50_9CORY|nr:hypothetical protein [Corynebacterium variabile]